MLRKSKSNLNFQQDLMKPKQFYNRNLTQMLVWSVLGVVIVDLFLQILIITKVITLIIDLLHKSTLAYYYQNYKPSK